MQDQMIGNVKLNLEYYIGQDQYSDGTIEDELLQIYKEKRQEEALMNGNEWAILYHVSPIRKNLLEWYDFDKNANMLEIGAGCGAMTELFCDKLKSVTAVDLSMKRSQINAERNREKTNLEIVVGNYESIEFKQTYDFISLIGVLEYSPYYISGDNPFDRMLQKIQSQLKPNGTLIIAIENKFGLKYFGGAREDHTGGYFDGIQDYINTDKVRTFSRPELSELLTKNGFKEQEFYYPVPDYKLPSCVYSDEHLPSLGDLRNMSKNYDNTRYKIFEEDIVYDQLCSDKMFQYFSNSFLVFAKM